MDIISKIVFIHPYLKSILCILLQNIHTESIFPSPNSLVQFKRSWPINSLLFSGLFHTVSRGIVKPCLKTFIYSKFYLSCFHRHVWGLMTHFSKDMSFQTCECNILWKIHCNITKNVKIIKDWSRGESKTPNDTSCKTQKKKKQTDRGSGMWRQK